MVNASKETVFVKMDSTEKIVAKRIALITGIDLLYFALHSNLKFSNKFF